MFNTGSGSSPQLLNTSESKHLPMIIDLTAEDKELDSRPLTGLETMGVSTLE
jgi:hypothetical protein